MLRSSKWIYAVSILSAVIAVLWLTGPVSAGVCSDTSAFVQISSVNYQHGDVLADGTWSVSGGANSVRLQYRIDTSLFQTETQSGTAGSWSFVDDFNGGCGSHAFQVCAAPRVVTSSSTTVCVDHETCQSDSFSICCLTADIDGDFTPDPFTFTTYDAVVQGSTTSALSYRWDKSDTLPLDGFVDGTGSSFSLTTGDGSSDFYLQVKVTNTDTGCMSSSNVYFVDVQDSSGGGGGGDEEECDPFTPCPN